ncbi:MAG: hypothetical protein IJ719_06140 [Clostridia bacterium]|nr:hypothetical protein [Clostridia bacterium]
MKLALLLYPHQNIRYRPSLLQIAEGETKMIMNAMEVSFSLTREMIGGAQFLIIETEKEMSRGELAQIWQCASMYMLFECVGEEMRPLPSMRLQYIGEDLPYLLKYKGKTNEMFTDSMITMGVCCSDFARVFDSQLIVCDPMAGKGTTPMLAIKRGYHGVGIEIGKSNVEEVTGYMNRYFEFHKIKYKHQATSLTVRGKNGGTQHKWVFSDSNAHFKDGDTRSFRMICGDTRNAMAYLKGNSVHLMVTDLPYGVQTGTAGKEDGLFATVSKALPEWFACIKPGGTLCMSFNTHTIRRDNLVSEGIRAGFTHVETGEMNHWVEQAIERDLIVLKKEGKKA